MHRFCGTDWIRYQRLYTNGVVTLFIIVRILNLWMLVLILLKKRNCTKAYYLQGKHWLSASNLRASVTSLYNTGGVKLYELVIHTVVYVNSYHTRNEK